jgi:hypothetical protein
MRCSEAWTILAETVWELPLHQSMTFWHALAAGRWARAVAVRQHLGVAVTIRVDLAHLCRKVLSPAVVVAVLEALAHEGKLRRAQVSHIEESILTQMDQYGCWRGEPWDGAVRASTLPPDVVRFADVGGA